MQGHGRGGHGAGSCPIVRVSFLPSLCQPEGDSPSHTDPHENVTVSPCWAATLGSCPLSPWG